jgi:hypothetical protein
VFAFRFPKIKAPENHSSQRGGFAPYLSRHCYVHVAALFLYCQLQMACYGCSQVFQHAPRFCSICGVTEARRSGSECHNDPLYGKIQVFSSVQYLRFSVLEVDFSFSARHL